LCRGEDAQSRRLRWLLPSKTIFCNDRSFEFLDQLMLWRCRGERGQNSERLIFLRKTMRILNIDVEDAVVLPCPVGRSLPGYSFKMVEPANLKSSTRISTRYCTACGLPRCRTEQSSSPIVSWNYSYMHSHYDGERPGNVVGRVEMSLQSALSAFASFNRLAS
jgi:hypothetical protein